MQQQVAAIFYIAEVQAQGTAISDNRTDWVVLIVPVGQPHATRPPESDFTVQTVHFVQFRIRRKLLGGDVNASARDRSDQAKRFFMSCIVRNDANFLPYRQRRILRQLEIHVPLDTRERLADGLNHRSENS